MSGTHIYREVHRENTVMLKVTNAHFHRRGIAVSVSPGQPPGERHRCTRSRLPRPRQEDVEKHGFLRGKSWKVVRSKLPQQITKNIVKTSLTSLFFNMQVFAFSFLY
jgi:hypothetical protein